MMKHCALMVIVACLTACSASPTSNEAADQGASNSSDIELLARRPVLMSMPVATARLARISGAADPSSVWASSNFKHASGAVGYDLAQPVGGSTLSALTDDRGVLQIRISHLGRGNALSPADARDTSSAAAGLMMDKPAPADTARLIEAFRESLEADREKWVFFGNARAIVSALGTDAFTITITPVGVEPL